MHADWKKKNKNEILNNISKKCNFALQQFHILRSFLSASRFRPTWGLSLALKHIWKDCISITSNNICCWVSAKSHKPSKKKSNAFLKWAPHFCIHSFFLLDYEDKVWKDECHQFFHSIAQEFSVKIESSKNHVPYLRPI